MKNMRKGFTIIEVLSVIIIIAMASVISIPKIDDITNQPKKLKVMTDLKSYEFAILELHYDKLPLTEVNISSIVDSELEFESGLSKADNPYGNKYKFIQNGIDDVTIESLKSGSRFIDTIQSLRAYKSGTRMIIEYKNMEEELGSSIIVERSAQIEPPSNVTDYYTFTLSGSTYIVSLRPEFKTAINSGTNYKDWKSGEPVPNPGSTYNGVDITSISYLFSGITAPLLDVSNVDTSNIVNASYTFKSTTSKIEGLQLWTMGKIANANGMFEDYNNENADIKLRFKSSALTLNVSGLFKNAICRNVDISSTQKDKIYTDEPIFLNSTIDEIKFGDIESGMYTDVMFFDEVNVGKVSIGNIKTPYDLNLSWFKISGGTEELDLSRINFIESEITNQDAFTTDRNMTYYFKSQKILDYLRSYSGLCNDVTMTLKSTNPENYYKYNLVGGGYAVSLTDGFKDALNNNRSYGKWTYGTPLPNPGRTYNNRPVISYNGTFMNINTESLDLTLWDTNNLIDTTAMFKGANIYLLDIRYWISMKSPMLSVKEMFMNATIGNIVNLNKLKVDGNTNPTDIFTGFSGVRVKVHESLQADWLDYETATTKIIKYVPPPVKVTDYYTFTAVTGGYKIALNASFRTALNGNVNYKDWVVGSPIPNPGSMYNGMPVTNLFNIFSALTATSLDLSTFDTSRVNDMTQMFYNITTTTVNMSNLDTSRAVDMGSMFMKSKISTLDLSNFNTKNVTKMTHMFSESSATTLDVTKFDTSNVTTMLGMFYSADALTLDLSNFNTSKVTNMSQMFALSSATSLKLTNFNTSNVEDMSGMFAISNVITLDLSSFSCPKVTSMYNMFGKSKITSLDISNMRKSSVKNIGAMFNGTVLTSIDISNLDTSNVTDMGDVFRDSKATIINVSKINTSNVTNMAKMFQNSTVSVLDIANFDTTNVTNMTNMFQNSKITSVDMSNAVITNATVTNALAGVTTTATVTVKDAATKTKLDTLAGKTATVTVKVKV